MTYFLILWAVATYLTVGAMLWTHNADRLHYAPGPAMHMLMCLATVTLWAPLLIAGAYLERRDRRRLGR